MALTLNRRAAEIADRMATHATDLGIAVAHLENGARVIDCGIAADGGLKVGRLMAEICLGGRATVSVTTVELGDLFLPAVRVAVDDPVEPCLASQYAGWAIHRPGRLLRPAAPALGASRAAGRRGRRPSRRSPRPPRRLREGRRDGIQSGPARPRLPAAHVPRRRTGVAQGLPGQARGPERLGQWCAPCTVEMPTLEALWQAYRERGLVVIGVSVDRGAPRGSLAPYLDHQRLTFPIVLDPISRRPRPGA